MFVGLCISDIAITPEEVRTLEEPESVCPKYLTVSRYNSTFLPKTMRRTTVPISQAKAEGLARTESSTYCIKVDPLIVGSCTSCYRKYGSITWTVTSDVTGEAPIDNYEPNGIASIHHSIGCFHSTGYV